MTGPVAVAVGDDRRLIAEALAALLSTIDGFAVTGALHATMAFGRLLPRSRTCS